jgi:hypothetical protein
MSHYTKYDLEDSRHTCQFCKHSKLDNLGDLICESVRIDDYPPAIKAVPYILAQVIEDGICGGYKPDEAKLAAEGLMLSPDGNLHLVEIGAAWMTPDEYNGVRRGVDYSMTL